MTIHDFAWMWQGILRGPLTLADVHYLKPIHEHRGGTARAILLLHGFSSTPAVFRELIPALTHYDAIVAPVLPGHGESVAVFARTSAEDWLRACESHCQALLNHYQHVDVLGLSLGGLLACHLSATFPLHHLYLLAPALALTFPLNMGPFIPKCIAQLGIKTLRSHGGNLHSQQFAELVYRRLPLTAIIEILSLIKQFQFTPPTCKTDLFLGAHDAVVASTQVEALFKPLPNAHIHWLKDSAHVLPLDPDRKIIIDCMKS